MHCVSNIGRTVSPKFTLKKGEMVPLQARQSIVGKNGFLQIGVQQYGKAGKGTWIDQRPSSEFPRDQYIYEAHEIQVSSDATEDEIIINFQSTQESSGQIYFKNWEAGFFRLQFCGDEETCFTTSNIGLSQFNYTGFLDETLTWLKTSCEPVGDIINRIYHGAFEVDDWPDANLIQTGVGAWCGRSARTVFNSEIWTSQISSMFSTTHADDLCFAFKGKIQYFQLQATITRSDTLTLWTGEMRVPVNWVSVDSFQWKCLKLSYVMQSWVGDGFHSVDNIYFGIQNIEIGNDFAEVIIVDEVHIGKIASTTFKMVQTRKALSYNGHTPRTISATVKYNDIGLDMFIKFGTRSKLSGCGYNIIMPKVLTPIGSMFVSSKDESTTAVTDWFNSFHEPIDNWISNNGMLINEHQDFESGKFEILDTNSLIKNAYDVIVMRKSVSDQELQVQLTISYGEDPKQLEVTIDNRYMAANLAHDLTSTWPELLNTFNIRVYRDGGCDTGYKFNILSTDHGIMNQFAVKGTSLSSSINPAWSATRLQSASVVTQVMPGSVMATRHNVPQIVIFANGQRSATDTNCDFIFNQFNTPNITEVNHTDGSEVSQIAAGNHIVIHFTMELGVNVTSAMLSLPTAKFGSVDSLCAHIVTITKLTHSTTCIIGQIESGNLSLSLTINEIGIAVFTERTFLSTLVLTSVFSDWEKLQHSSIYGGFIATVTGNTFFSGTSVYIQLRDEIVTCTNEPGLLATYNLMQCRLSSRSSSDGNSPILAEISITRLGAFGGEEVSIQGKHFGEFCETNFVTLNDDKMRFEISHWSDSYITVITNEGSGILGESQLYVYACGVGYSNNVTVNIVFEITAVFAVGANGISSSLVSSVHGGNILRIDGLGFPVDQSVNVKIGHIDCDVRNATHNQITCITGM